MLQKLLQSAHRKYLAMVGRFETYVRNPDMGTLPVSCTIHVPTFDLQGVDYLVQYVSHALRTGAGINVHLDNFQANHNTPPRLAECYFILHYTHPEHKSTISYQGWSSPCLSEAPPECTVKYVSDSMTEGNEYWCLDPDPDAPLDSIESSIFAAYEAGLYNQPVAFDLSALRPDNVANELGMVSSGAVSFAFIIKRAYEFGQHQTIGSLLAFLSSFNAVLRRGGTYKNGAITTSIPIWHPEAQAYLETPKEQYPWLKQGLVLPSDYLEFSDLLPLVYTKVNNGGLWLEKAVQQLPIGYEWLSSSSPKLKSRLRSNVCREILIPDRATCNLSHLNAGQITNFEQLPEALCYVTQVLCELHKTAPQDASRYYLPAAKDRQIGVGIVGLSNMLAIHGITYKEHIQSLKNMLDAIGDGVIWEACDKSFLPENPFALDECSEADWLAYWLIIAYIKAARVAYSYNMFRAFTIAPTANSSFRYEDSEFFTTSPEISPPMAHTIERISETQEEQDIFFYNPKAELAIDVGWDTYFELVSTYQRLMNATGLGHSISFNVWEDIDQSWLQKWADSDILTTYYRLDVDQSALNKADQFEPRGGEIKCACGG